MILQIVIYCLFHDVESWKAQDSFPNYWIFSISALCYLYSLHFDCYYLFVTERFRRDQGLDETFRVAKRYFPIPSFASSVSFFSVRRSRRTARARIPLHPVRRDRGITYVEPYVRRGPSVLALVPRSDEQESSGGTWPASWVGWLCARGWRRAVASYTERIVFAQRHRVLVGVRSTRDREKKDRELPYLSRNTDAQWCALVRQRVTVWGKLVRLFVE